MLVVTRKPHEKIVFPSLGVSVQILRLNRQAAKVGIEAPPEVRILRDELADSTASHPGSLAARKADHALANALSKVTLAIHLARKQSAAGLSKAADTTLATALQALDSLDRDRQTRRAASPCRALIVEDDTNERELLAGLLAMNGYECITAADGVEALQYLATHDRPDVVLLDMALPRCDGPETLRRIRADERLAGLRVFSVSSTSPRELSIPEGPSGFDGWFPKPLNPRRLCAVIQSAVASPTAN